MTLCAKIMKALCFNGCLSEQSTDGLSKNQYNLLKIKLIETNTLTCFLITLIYQQKILCSMETI